MFLIINFNIDYRIERYNKCVWANIQYQYHLWFIKLYRFFQSVVPFLNILLVPFILRLTCVIFVCVCFENLE